MDRILEEIKAGRLRLENPTSSSPLILKFHQQIGKFQEKTLRPKNGRRQNRSHVRLVYGCNNSQWEPKEGAFRFTTSYSRLVWMIHHQEIPPRHYQIHHIDEDRDNNSVLNLLLVSPEEHARLHYPVEDTRETFT